MTVTTDDFWMSLERLRTLLAQGPEGRAGAASLLAAIARQVQDIDDGRQAVLEGLAQSWGLEAVLTGALTGAKGPAPAAARTADLPGLPPATIPATVPVAGPVAVPATAHAVAAVAGPAPQGRPLGPPPDPALPGISLVTCCKNRNENLIRALPSWLALSGISEIVVVDWGSDVPVADDLARAGLTDPRIRIARAEDEPRWVLSYAFNLGFRLARHAQVLKADADIVLDPGFLQANPLPRGAFIAGNWRTAGEGQQFVNGFFQIHRDDLFAVNGFNEYITTYGWDDDDLYDRLVAAGMARIDVAAGSVHHLDHDDDARMDDRIDARLTGWDDLRSLALYKIRTNRFIAFIMPHWDRNRMMLPFRVTDVAENRLSLRRSGLSPHVVPDHLAATAAELAAYELVSWRAGIRTFDLRPDQLDLLLQRQRLEAITPRDVDLVLAGTALPASLPTAVPKARDRLYIDAQHGLGNRMRAIGSAHAIAQATGRELVVVWEPDHHCEARLTDLFDWDGPLIERAFPAEAAAQGASVLNYMEIEAGSHKDAPLVLEAGRDAYLRSAYVINHPASTWDSENALLRALRPAAPVRRLLEGLPAEIDIGLHVRMEGAPGTDTNSYDRIENWTAEGHAAIQHWRSQSHYGRFMTRLDALLAAEPEARIFLAADSPETYRAFRDTYGARVQMLERALYDRSARQMQHALADILMLARCRHFLGSHWSSFSELALRISGRIARRETAGIDF
jgi:glycosyltransferase involved in cell wall biosynthesis